MIEILSQDEIDALLSAIETGDLRTEEIKEDTRRRKIKIYDFKRPDILTDEQTRHIIYECDDSYVQLVNGINKANNNIFVQELNIVSADQIPFEEFTRSLNSLSCTQEFKIGTESGYFNINQGMMNYFSQQYAVDPEKIDEERVIGSKEKAAKVAEFVSKTLVTNMGLLHENAEGEDQVAFKLGEYFSNIREIISNHKKIVLLVTYEARFRQNYKSLADYFDKLDAENKDNLDNIDKYFAERVFLSRWHITETESNNNVEIFGAFRRRWKDISANYGDVSKIDAILLEELASLEIPADEDAAGNADKSKDAKVIDAEERKKLYISEKRQQLMENSDRVVQKHDDLEGMIKICLPMDPFLKKFKEDNREAGKNEALKVNKDILAKHAVRLEVEMGRKDYPVSDLMDMSTGGIIEFDKKAGEEFEVYIADELYSNVTKIARCRIEIEDEILVARITEIVDGEKYKINKETAAAITIRGVLGETYLTAENALALRKGDKLYLGRMSNSNTFLDGSNISIRSKNEELYKGEVITIDENFGVRITQISQDYLKENEKDKAGRDHLAGGISPDGELYSLNEKITSTISQLRPLLQQLKDKLTNRKKENGPVAGTADKGDGSDEFEDLFKQYGDCAAGVGKHDLGKVDPERGPSGIPLDDAGQEQGDDDFGSEENLRSLLAQFADGDAAGAGRQDLGEDVVNTFPDLLLGGDEPDDVGDHETSEGDMRGLLKQFADQSKPEEPVLSGHIFRVKRKGTLGDRLFREPRKYDVSGLFNGTMAEDLWKDREEAQRKEAEKLNKPAGPSLDDSDGSKAEGGADESDALVFGSGSKESETGGAKAEQDKDTKAGGEVVLGNTDHIHLLEPQEP